MGVKTHELRTGNRTSHCPKCGHSFRANEDKDCPQFDGPFSILESLDAIWEAGLKDWEKIEDPDQYLHGD